MDKKERRVVVTGLGVVAPNGQEKEVFWDNLIHGRSFIRKITKFDPKEHFSKVAAEIDYFDPKDYIDSKQLKRTDLSTHYAIAAAKKAVFDSGLNIKNEDPERIGIVIGIAIFGINFCENEFKNYAKAFDLKDISIYTTIAVFCCASVGQMSIDMGIKGYNNTTSTGCTSGTVAIGNAYHAVKYGEADMIITGGTEAPITPINLYGFCTINALSKRNDEPQRASRPFDKQRDGFVPSEGAGMLVIEELEHALKRKAHIYAEITGYGSTSNAYHMTAPEPSGEQSAKAMRVAIEKSNISFKDVDYINAHGSSTPLNGVSETRAIKKVFGEQAYNIPISSIKSMIGHPLGAAGAFQTITNCLVIEKGTIPPTINYEYPDPDCDLNYVPNKAIKKNVNTALLNSAGFSGVNAALVLKKYK
jgi:3-oxoacyl-[acyl-carrier-protein] synthase II